MQNAILITGAGQRIGLYLAQQFLAQGQPVVFTYRTEHPEVTALMAQGALGIQIDFLQEDALERVFDGLQAVSSLRAVIHNASVWQKDADLIGGGYEAMFRLHMALPFALTEMCVPWLEASDAELKDVIAISDAQAQKGHPDYAAYLSTKAGLDSLIQSLAKKHAPAIKVNQVSPGLVIFNAQDSEAYRQMRLAKSAIPIEPGAEVIWQAVDYLMRSPYSSGAKIELGQLQRPFR